MALVIDNLITKGFSGKFGKQVVFRQCGNKTVAAAYPRLPLPPPTERQLAQRKKFAMAVLQTRQWLLNKVKRNFLDGLARKWDSLSPYHAGIKYFMLAKPANTDAASGQNMPQQTVVPGSELKPKNTVSQAQKQNTTGAATKEMPPR